MRNAGLSFICRTVEVSVANTGSIFTKGFAAGERLSIPIAHHDGNYAADDATLDRLEGDDRIALRYVDNPNGSARDIAGILNKKGNVLGLMPHPERVIAPELGGEDGGRSFEGLTERLAR